MTNQKQNFRAVIENPGGGGAFVTVPFDVVEESTLAGSSLTPLKVIMG